MSEVEFIVTGILIFFLITLLEAALCIFRVPSYFRIGIPLAKKKIRLPSNFHLAPLIPKTQFVLKHWMAARELVDYPYDSFHIVDLSKGSFGFQLKMWQGQQTPLVRLRADFHMNGELESVLYLNWSFLIIVAFGGYLWFVGKVTESMSVAAIVFVLMWFQLKHYKQLLSQLPVDWNEHRRD